MKDTRSSESAEQIKSAQMSKYGSTVSHVGVLVRTQPIRRKDDFFFSALSFRQYLAEEVALSEEMVHKYSDMVLAKLNKSIGEVRRLFLVEDLVDSIKVSSSCRQRLDSCMSTNGRR